jgi:hypothetical protein
MRSILLWCSCALALALPLHAQPSFLFQPDSVKASGFTPAGDIVFLGAARIAEGYSRHMATGAERVTDADGDGTVDVRRGARTPKHSVWIAVDLSSGATAVSSPDPAGAVHTREKLSMGQVRQLTRSGDYVMFLLVRPRVGAWTQTVEDSGYYDSDSTPDLKVKLDVERMQPVGDSPSAPRHLEKTDVVFAVDPMNLTVVELRNE